MAPADSAPERAPAPAQTVQLTPAQLFVFADAARDQARFDVAEQAYRALAANPDPELRAEARFRLALMLADRQHKYREAAVELRRILDEKPGAARVRLELARIQALLGDLGAARRELRAAQAAGLPPEVERAVRFYAAALQAGKPFGGSIELALAPDSNINRATRSDTLGTVIGNFALDDNARARSGLGLALRGQAWLRQGLDRNASLLARISTSATLYRDPQFRDVTAGFQLGPEFRSGTDRITLTAGPTWRWYGTDPYSRSLGGEGAWLHLLGPKAQARVALGLTRTVNQRNALQTGTTYALSTGLDRALSARAGLGLGLTASRTAAQDPGWSDASGGATAYAWREAGRTTLVATLGYNRLEADARLFLFPRRRVDDRFTASLAATWRGVQWKGFAPLTRVSWERNRSTVELYAYRRISAELGITSAF
ncbi:surface lipoprotein assembly modifier [Novosphingobium flavum]|uniref:surface lipoprotein assembly modifier n=1 Tax=Novosphingobium flavum TaxID=1778672 RepID=UPI0031B5CB14